MPTAIIFPESLLREQSSNWRITGSVATPGTTASGASPRVRLDGGGRWVVELSSINLKDADQIRLWRALETLADGGVMPMVVPMCDKRHFPAPIVNGQPLYSYGSIPFSDGSFFSDGSGWYQPAVDVVATSAAALRATTLVMTLNHCGALRGGEYFSIEHPTEGWRLYKIGTAIDNLDGSYTVTFRTPLREAVDAGTVIEFDVPRCTMALPNPEAMAMVLERRRFANPSVAFVETFFNI